MTQSNRRFMSSMSASAVAPAHQIGIRQRSLRRHCRLGRATELVFILATGLTLVLSGGAEAQTWDGDLDEDFLTGPNWSGNVVPGAGGAVVISNGALLDQPVLGLGDTSTVASVAVSAGSLTVDGLLTAGLTTISGGTVNVGLAGGITGNVGITSGTLNNDGTVTGNVTSAGAGSNDGTITGTLGVTGGTFNNAGGVGGATSISAGVLNLNAGSNLANGATLTATGGTVNVNANDTVGGVSLQGGAINGAATLTSASDFDVRAGSVGAVLGGAVGLTKTTAGTVTLSGANTYSGLTIVNAGTLTVGNVDALSDQFEVNGATSILDLGGNSVTAFAGLLTAGGTLSNGTLITTAVDPMAIQLLDGSVSANLAGVGGVTVAGGTNSLSGTNTYSGATAIQAGTLTITNSAALGSAAAGTTVSSGAALELSGGISTAEAITLNGSGVASGGALRNLSGTNTVTGVITLGGNASVMVDAGQLNIGDVTGTNTTLTVGGAAGDLHLTGPITTGTGGLIKTGAATVWVEGINTFTGNTTINGGVLDVQNGSALSDTGLVTVNAGSLIVRDSETVGNIAGAGNIFIAAGETLTAGDASNTTFSGQIVSPGALTKTGTGTLTLSNSNTYAGPTTINGGVLDVTGSIASLVVDVNAGGSLHADGSALADLAAVTLSGNGNLTLTGSEEIGSLASGSGTSTVTLNAHTLTTGGNNTSTTFAGIIGGAGGVTKTGTGTMTLTGANTFTGATSVTGGGLTVTGAGALASTAVAVSGGTLTTDSDALAAGAVVTVSSGTFTSSGTDSYTGITQTGGTINGSGVHTLSGTFAQSGGTTAGTVDINAATFTQSGGATIAAGTTVSSAGAQSLQGGAIAGALDGAGAITVATGSTALSGSISNAASLTVASGALNLSGSGSVDTSGNAITVSGGTLSNIANGIADDEVVTVSGTGTLTATAADTIAALVQTGGTVGGAGLLTAATYTQSGGDMAGLVDTTTSATLNGGTISGTLSGAVATVQTGTTTVTGTISGNVVVDGAGRLRIEHSAAIGGTITTTGSVVSYANGVDEASALILNSNTTQLEVLAADAATQSGVISGAHPLEKIGTGTLTFSGANTFTGDMTVSAGTLNLSGGSALADSVKLILASGATVNVDSAETIGELAANGGVTNLNAVLTAGGLSGAAGSVVGTALTGLVVGNASNSSFGGIYSGGGFLTKVGTGTQTMTGANTYTGATTVNAGTLAFTGAGSALGTSGVTIAAGAVLSSDGAAFANTLAISNSGGFTLTAGGDESIASINGAGTIDLSAGSVLTLNTGASAVSGVISGGGALVVDGTSATTLSAVNTFTGGTTVNAGTLDITAAGALAGTLTTAGGATTNAGVVNAAVHNGGTFSNTGTITTTLTVGSDGFTNAATGAVNGNVAVNTGTLVNNGALGDAVGDSVTVAAAGLLTNNGASAVVSGTTTNNGGSVTNNGGSFGVVNNTAGTFANTTGSAGAVTNAGTGTNGGTIASLDNTAGTFGNTGTITGNATVSGGAVTNSGVSGSIGGTLGVSGGTVDNSATVVGATTITGTGAVTNSGTMAAVTNSASYTATAATTGALINTGTASVTGGTTASVTNNAALATTTLAGAAVTGAVTNTAGTVTSTGITTALSLANSGIVNAVGTLDTAVTNNAGGTFNVTGLLAAGGKAFTNAGILNVTAANYGGLGTFNNNAGGVVNLGDTRTITGVTLNNNVGGTFVIAGDATIAGAFVNNGTVDMADGTVGQVLTLTGATSGTGIYQLDLNLSDGTHDRVNATLGGVSQIHLDFDTVGGGILLGPIVVFTGAAAGATLTQQDLPLGGAILYSIQQSGNDVQVVSSINPAVSGVAASAAMTQSLISTVVNRPTSPFVSGLAAEETCSHGGYFRASGGVANVTGTATSNGVASDSTISSRFSGVQGGYDVGCFDGRFFDGWDGAMGVMMGYNAGSTSQNVFSDPINPTLQTGTSGSDFKQSYLGLYAAGSKDRFSGDLQLRFDRTEFDLTETALAGFEIGLDGLNYTTKSTTIGSRFNYRFDLNEEKGINFVPTVGFNYTTVSGNMLTLDDNATPLNTSDDETLTINGYNTVVGFLGGTLAKTKIDPEGSSATTTFVSGNYYQDFGGDRTASYDNNALPGAEQINIGSIGGFAEASVGINFVKILDKGPGGAKQLNANVRADARFGPNVSDSYSVTAQIRLSF